MSENITLNLLVQILISVQIIFLLITYFQDTKRKRQQKTLDYILEIRDRYRQPQASFYEILQNKNFTAIKQEDKKY